MIDIVSLVNEYIRSELLIVTPVLYIIARIMENSHMNRERIPWLLLLISVVLAALYTFAASDVSSLAHILMAIFSSIVQGVLLSGTAIFGGILGSLTKKQYDTIKSKNKGS